MSRPRISVPKRCALVGGARILVVSISSGAYGDRIGAAMATAKRMATTINPATASLFFANLLVNSLKILTLK